MKEKINIGIYLIGFILFAVGSLIGMSINLNFEINRIQHECNEFLLDHQEAPIYANDNLTISWGEYKPVRSNKTYTEALSEKLPAALDREDH